MSNTNNYTLVLGSTGKTGSRVAHQLEEMGIKVKRGSRSTTPSFDWNDSSNWEEVLEDVKSVYITYYPDLALPSAPAHIEAFTDLAVEKGVEHIVILSGRGEPAAQQCEGIIRESGADYTILRCGWFAENFSEGAFTPYIQAGHLSLPVAEVKEAFVSVDDIAAAAVAALTDPEKHKNELYEITGPRLMSFEDIVSEISEASGREIMLHKITFDEFQDQLEAHQVPEVAAKLLVFLFQEVLDGRNEYLTDGIQRALGREPKDFRDYAADVAKTGIWNAPIGAAS